MSSLHTSAAATQAFSGDLSKLAVNAKASAEVQVAASVKKTARLRAEMAAYREVASAAERGSQEQVVAANLAARAQTRLAGSMGVSSVESRRLSSASGNVERDIGRASRGALAGTGIFRAFGRSLAFASGGFLAFASAGQFIRTSIDAARAADVTQRQLNAQFRASGVDLKDYQGQIDATTSRLSALAGVPKDQLDAAFTTIFRGSGNVSKALRDTALAADIAAARNISVAQAAIAVGKAAAGSTTALRRLGIEFPKGASGAEALALAEKKFAGQAAASATEQSRFSAILHNSEVIIGQGLLPTLNGYLAKGAAWLQQMNESGRLQKDVASDAAKLKTAISDGAAVVHLAADAIRAIDRVTGSFTNTLKNLASVWLILKARTALIAWNVIGSEIAAAGTSAAIASGEVSLLAARLGTLAALGPIVGPLNLLEDTKVGSKAAHSNVNSATSLFHDLFPGHGVHPLSGFNDKTATDLSHLLFGTPLSSGTPPPLPKPFVFPKFDPTKDDPFKKAAAAYKRAHPQLSLAGQFNLDELRLADAALANNTKLQRSILESEETIVLKLRDQAKTLADRTKYAQQAASIEGSISSLDQQGVTAANKEAAARKKAGAARAKAALGGVPLALQLAQAKADAIAAGMDAQDLTKGQIAAARAIRNSEYKAINSHLLSMQGLIDAWTEIGSINSQLGGAAKGLAGTYHKVSTLAITAGLGLTRDARVAGEERLAQRAAHRGYRPTSAAALGYPVGSIILNNPQFYGVRDIAGLYSELQKVAKRQPRAGKR